MGAKWQRAEVTKQRMTSMALSDNPRGQVVRCILRSSLAVGTPRCEVLFGSLPSLTLRSNVMRVQYHRFIDTCTSTDLHYKIHYTLLMHPACHKSSVMYITNKYQNKLATNWVFYVFSCFVKLWIDWRSCMSFLSVLTFYLFFKSDVDVTLMGLV